MSKGYWQYRISISSDHISGGSQRIFISKKFDPEKEQEKDIAVQRLCNMIQRRVSSFMHVSSSLSVGLGTEVSQEEQKKRNIGGKRSAISRVRNSMERIKEQYSQELFPETYKGDPRYKDLERKLQEKEKELEEYSKLEMYSNPQNPIYQ